MSGFIGMDTKVVRSAAAGLTVQSGTVGSVLAHLEAAVSQTGSHWYGADANDFVHLWSSTFRPQLQAVQRLLDEMASTAVTNADQQDGTSGAGGGVGGGVAVGSGGPGGSTGGVREGVEIPLPLGLGVTIGGGVLTGLSTLSANKFVTGRYTDNWRRVIEKSGAYGELMKFKGSPVLQTLNQHQGLLKNLDTAGNVVGKGFTAVSVLKEGGDLLGSIRSGNGFHVVGDALETGGSALGFLKATPVTYLGSVAAKGWGQVAHEAAKVDWSPSAMVDTFNYGKNNLNVVGEELGKATKQVLTKDIWGWL